MLKSFQPTQLLLHLRPASQLHAYSHIRNFTNLQRQLRGQYDQNAINRQYIEQAIKNNPELLTNPQLLKPGLRWRTVLLLIATSSSLSMLLYLTVQIYKVSSDTSTEVKPRSVFLPLWLSVNWPYQRKYSFPSYLQYLDPDYFSYVDAFGDYSQELHLKNVQYQVLDGLFRLTVVRDLFGIPLTLKATEEDKFDMWIEPKYPTVHGPEVQLSKQDKLHLEWRWSVNLVRWWSSVDSFLTGIGVKLDRLDTAQAKTHEKSSGRVHEASHSKLKISTGDRDYKVVFKGTFHLSDTTKAHCGIVGYCGVIDFDHLGINNGVRVVLLDLTVPGESGSVVYKLS